MMMAAPGASGAGASSAGAGAGAVSQQPVYCTPCCFHQLWFRCTRQGSRPEQGRRVHRNEIGLPLAA
jgi:hypothetical protein